MKFLKPNKEYVNQAVNLVIHSYENEKKVCQSLPSVNSDDFELCKNTLIENLSSFFEMQKGTIAVTDDNTLSGFIVFPYDNINGFFSNGIGAYCPLLANAFSDTQNFSGGMSREKVASYLLQNEIERLSKIKHSSFAITLNAHDTSIIDVFNMNGFGKRCSDLIKTVQSRNVDSFYKNEKLKFDKISINELKDEKNKDKLEQMFSLSLLLENHLIGSPVFLNKEIPNLDAFIEKETDKNSTFYYAENQNGKLLGYISIGHEGENWISNSLCENRKMVSICGAITDNNYRGSFISTKTNKKTSIAEQILFYIENELSKTGIQYFGVDCETINPSAINFWSKYFETNTFSMHRIIDARNI